MSFQTIATPFIELGIPVFPLSPGTKIPLAGFKFLEKASTNAETIAQWNTENPDYNVALLANDDYCFLEFDIPNGFSKAAKFKGEELPITRTQVSGKGFAHYIFRHTNYSRALGNRSANLKEACVCKEQDNRTCMVHGCGAGGPHHHHEWFSFRADRKYLVGAGSKHPNGKFYKNFRSIEPIPIPNWVVDYVSFNTPEPAKPVARPTDVSSVSEDFDFDDLMDFFNITIDHVKDGCWHVVAECPGTGCPHEHSTLTAFYWDGVNLGWSCFAQGCPAYGMRIGELIKFLNDKKGEPYTGPIWEQESDEELMDDDSIEDDEISDLFREEGTETVSAAMLAEITGAVDITPKEENRCYDKLPVNPYAKVPLTTMEDVEKSIALSEKLMEPVLEQELNTFLEESEGTEPENSEDKPKEKPVHGMNKMSRCTTDDGNTLFLITRKASDIVTTRLKWLWENRIPAGKITLVTGKPGCGKSTVVADIIARVTNGTDFPDGTKNTMGPKQVLIAASEDDPSDTLVPRLQAAGANLEKVHIIEMTCLQGKEKKGKRGLSRKTLDLKRDAKMLLDAVQQNPDIALLVLDPITSFFGQADQNKDKDIRPVMDAIAHLCQKCGITVVGLIHGNKRSDVDALQKVLGASAVAGSARAVWGFSTDPEDKEKHHMTLVKGNLSKKRSGMEYHIGDSMIDIAGEQVSVPHVIWGAEVEMDADDILNNERAHAKEGRADNKMDMAAILINAWVPIKARELYEKGEKDGINADQFKRARTRMNGIAIGKEPGVRGQWWWYKEGTREPWLEEPEVPIEIDSVN
jgi:hypothetical protein